MRVLFIYQHRRRGVLERSADDGLVFVIFISIRQRQDTVHSNEYWTKVPLLCSFLYDPSYVPLSRLA